MDVTRDNFRDTIPLVFQAIEEANFISIDGEFTGLTNGSYNLTVYDSPDERYFKQHYNTEHFILLQFGLCTFVWDAKKKEYKTKAFNFYIFPFRSSFPGVPDRIFSCQSSSLDFLTQQGFDFNKAFQKGIPFLRPNEETSVRNSLEEKKAYRDSTYKSPGKGSNTSLNVQSPSSFVRNSPTPITDNKTKEFMDSTVKQVQKFLDDESQGDELILSSCNSYLRKILFEALPSAFPDKILLESRTDEKNHMRRMVVVRGAGEDIKKERQKKAEEEEENSLNDAIGFAKVVKKLSQSQKLIIGHNCLLDVMYTIRQFICPLPPSLDDFKSLVTCVFPKLVDTKLMGSMLPFRDILQSTALGDMYNRLKEPPFFKVDIGIPGKYMDHDKEKIDDNLHEAAYDAFVTGSCFVSLIRFLSSFQKSNDPTTNSSLNKLTSPYLNKIFLMRSHDIPYLNLVGPDLTPSRDHVFHVEFPSSWRANDLRQLFLPVGQINISWINETQCFVGLYNKAQAKQIQKLISPSLLESCCIKIHTYNEYHEELQHQNFFQAPGHNKKWVNNQWQNSTPNHEGLEASKPIPQPSPSMSFTSSMQATSISNGSNTPTSSHRKRPTGVDLVKSGVLPKRSSYEPQEKKQKSGGESTTESKDSEENKTAKNGQMDVNMNEEKVPEKNDDGVNVKAVSAGCDLGLPVTRIKSTEDLPPVIPKKIIDEVKSKIATVESSKGFEVPEDWE